MQGLVRDLYNNRIGVQRELRYRCRIYDTGHVRGMIGHWISIYR